MRIGIGKLKRHDIFANKDGREYVFIEYRDDTIYCLDGEAGKYIILSTYEKDVELLFRGGKLEAEISEEQG